MGKGRGPSQGPEANKGNNVLKVPCSMICGAGFVSVRIIPPDPARILAHQPLWPSYVHLKRDNGGNKEFPELRRSREAHIPQWIPWLNRPRTRSGSTLAPNWLISTKINRTFSRDSVHGVACDVNM